MLISPRLFDGYDDPMIDLAKGNPLLDAGHIPFDKFGWFYMVRSVTIVSEGSNKLFYWLNLKAKRQQLAAWRF